MDDCLLADSKPRAGFLDKPALSLNECCVAQRLVAGNRSITH